MQKYTVADKIKVHEVRSHDTNFFGIATAEFMGGSEIKRRTIGGKEYNLINKLIEKQKAQTFEQTVMAQAGTIDIEYYDTIYDYEVPSNRKIQRRLLQWSEAPDMDPSQKTNKPGFGLSPIYLEFEGAPYDNNYIVTFALGQSINQIHIEERLPSNGSTSIYKATVWPYKAEEFIDRAALDSPETRFVGGYSLRSAELSGPQGMLGMYGSTAKMITGATKMRFDLHASNDFFIKRARNGEVTCREVVIPMKDRNSGKELNSSFLIDDILWMMAQEVQRMKAEAWMWGKSSIIDDKNPLSPFNNKHKLDTLSQTPLKTGSGFMELISGSSYFTYSRVTVDWLEGLIEERFRGLVDDMTTLKLKVVLAPKPYRELMRDAYEKYADYLSGDSTSGVNIIKADGTSGGFTAVTPKITGLSTLFGYQIEIEMSQTFENEYNVLDMRDYIMILDYSPVVMNGKKFESNINKIVASKEPDSYYYVAGARDMFKGTPGTINAPVPVASTKDGVDFGVLFGTGAACLAPYRILFGTKARLSFVG